MILLLYLTGAQSMFKRLTFHRILEANCEEKLDDWLATEGINNEMEVNNLKAPSQKEITKWILDG